MEDNKPTGEIGKDGHEAPESLKVVCITQSIPNLLFNAATRKSKKQGFRSVQEYINQLIRKDNKL